MLPTTDYLLFHSQIRRPIWEDPLNIDGGKWIIRLRKGIADRLWEDLVLGIIGDQFEEEDEICGCVLSVRTQEDILSVWNKNEKDPVARGENKVCYFLSILILVQSIGLLTDSSCRSDTIRKLLNLPPSTIMEYKSNNGMVSHLPPEQNNVFTYALLASTTDSMQDKSSFRTTSIDRSGNAFGS